MPSGSTDLEWIDAADGLRLFPPDDLRRRYQYLPAELQRDDQPIQLTTDRDRVMVALEEARRNENSWPEWELLWDLHPVSRWLADRLLAEFGRRLDGGPCQEAPILRVSRGVVAAEQVFVVHGLCSNFLSQPTIVDWVGIRCRDGAIAAVEPLAEIVRETGLDDLRTNPAIETSPELLARLSALLPLVVRRAAAHMSELRNQRSVDLGDQLRTSQRRLARWHDQRLAAIDADRNCLSSSQGHLTKAQQQRLDRDQQEAERVYQERKRWIEESMRTVKEPYLRIAAVLLHREAC
ncbi:MAG TPA: hypothetical protein VEB21_07945 [Terriglobales bacterium]|nr:hypothetical protein [Terriglobales bacterium]